MNVALVGFGIENQAVYRYFIARGITPVICDQNAELKLPEGITSQLGENYLDNLGNFDVIVRSVGIHPKVILEKYPGVEGKITTAVNLFFEENKTPVIGVTGTKGKGTTSTLITKILEAAGKKVVLAGNIGTPMLDVFEEAKNCDFVVLELSSFQLYDLKHSPSRAVCLMVVPDHLNWHSDFEDYKRSKANLFRYQKSDDVAVFNEFCNESKEIASASPAVNKYTYAVPKPGEHIISPYTAYVENDLIRCYKDDLFQISEVKLPGRHNLENICAAIAATWDIINGNKEVVHQVVSTFSGLEFRLQNIRELDGVKYINDSFSTTLETAIAAIEAFQEPKIMILGGDDKGIPFDVLARGVVAGNVKSVLAIGKMGPVIAKLLQNIGYTNFSILQKVTMVEIVQKARSLSSPGDIVLLSTGCTSFDMFKDYKDRGNQFNQAVQSLT